jgi:hypothetical protein
MFKGKRTYGEFLQSEEKIATKSSPTAFSRGAGRDHRKRAFPGNR